MSGKQDIEPSRSVPAGCQWPGIGDPLYTLYHDREWGVPKTRDGELFEKLTLEGFQAGLSWITILRKRDQFRRSFDGFDTERIAQYGDRDIARLMNDKGIVRNRLKITATIDNARAYLELRKHTTLSAFLWGMLENGPVINTWRTHGEIPAQTQLSRCISNALKAEGFRFVGPTTTYAFMQSVGMVNDHLISCPRHGPCSKLMASHRPLSR